MRSKIDREITRVELEIAGVEQGIIDGCERSLSEIFEKGRPWYRDYGSNWNSKKFKRFIFERDDCRCQNPDCDRVSDKLIRHHIDYDKKNCKLDNLIVLCVACNVKANSNKVYWQEFYSKIRMENC